MFNNIRGILNIGGDQPKSPSRSESVVSKTSGDTVENSSSSAEGFLCPECRVGFPTAEALQNHYESNHSSVNNSSGEGFVCPACKMKLGSEMELTSHYTRHHSWQKEEPEMEVMRMQVKALEESKVLLQDNLHNTNSRLTEVTKENAEIKEERNSFQLKTRELEKELSDLKIMLDEMKTDKLAVESSLNSAEEKVAKLEVEIQQRPEADDVNVLKQEIKTVQKIMDVQRESEKKALQTQCDKLSETCLKLQAEKTELENQLKLSPKVEEIKSLQDKLSKMSETITQMQQKVNQKESEKNKLQLTLEKYADYEALKSQVAETSKIAQEKEEKIAKLFQELSSEKETVKKCQDGRDKLLSKIEEGEGINTAILQLKEENARLQEQFLVQQMRNGESADQFKQKLGTVHSELSQAHLEIQALQKGKEDLEEALSISQAELKEALGEKEKFCSKVSLLTADKESNEGQVQKLGSQLREATHSLSEKTQHLDSLLKENVLCEKRIEKLEQEKTHLEKQLSELGSEKQKALLQTEQKLRQFIEQCSVEKEKASTLSNEMHTLQESYQEMKLKLRNMENLMSDAETAKIEFCNKISHLNEELLKCQSDKEQARLDAEEAKQSESNLQEKLSRFSQEMEVSKGALSKVETEKKELLREVKKGKEELLSQSEMCRLQTLEIGELQRLHQEEKQKGSKVLQDLIDAKDHFLKEKVNLQKQIEILEIDCAKQLSQTQENVKQLENQLEEAEEKNNILNGSLEEMNKEMKKKEMEWSKTKAQHISQVAIFMENVKTLKEDLHSEQTKRESLEQKLDEVCGTKLELEAKLENALEERASLLERCSRSEDECEKLQKSRGEMRKKYEDCVAALQELGRENQTLQVENMKHISRKWTDDSEVTHCTACGKLFTVTIRRHHCRNCGNIFCNECSAKTATVAAFKKPVRVCEVCFVEVAKMSS